MTDQFPRSAAVDPQAPSDGSPATADPGPASLAQAEAADTDDLSEPSAHAGAGPASRPVPPAAARGRQFGTDMIRSLGLVALVLLGMVLLAYPRVPDPVKPVDWRAPAQSAAAVAEYAVLVPPGDWPWVATSARVEPQPDGTVIWRAGFLTPEGTYAGLLQRGAFPQRAGRLRDDWIDEQTRGGQGEGSWSGPGGQWRRLVGTPEPDEKRSLVRVDGSTVTIVTGSASWSRLEQLAGVLAPLERR